jgi:AraC-like DNA-binding protein
VQSDDATRDDAALWDIATPTRRSRLPGLTMAGFRERPASAVDLHIVPYPAVTVAVDLGQNSFVVDDAHGAHQRGCVVLGLAPETVHAIGQEIECLQLRLSPVVAHSVLSASPELGGTVIGLEDLWGRDAGRVQEQLQTATSWDARFAIAEAALARRVEASHTVDPEVAYVWQQMVLGRGRVRVDRLAVEVGWSRKRLWSRFRAQIGLTPKRAAQLVRFDHAAHRLAAGDSAALVAAEAGYVDQSHLHRDSVAFAGLSPGALALAPWLAVDEVAWAAPDYASRLR